MIALAGLLPQVLSQEGRFILADPGRTHLDHFRKLMSEAGSNEQPLASVEEVQLLSNGPTKSCIRILQFAAARRPR
jgi:hypothetical protein